MRVNVQKFHRFIYYMYDFLQPRTVWFKNPVTVEYALDYAKNNGCIGPIVQPVFETEQKQELYLRTLQQQARAAFHLQEQEKLEG